MLCQWHRHFSGVLLILEMKIIEETWLHLVPIKCQNTIKCPGLTSEFYYTTKQKKKEILGNYLCGYIAFEQMVYISLDAIITQSNELLAFYPSRIPLFSTRWKF